MYWGWSESMAAKLTPDLMEFNPDGTIKPVVPTQTGIVALQPAPPQRDDFPKADMPLP